MKARLMAGKLIAIAAAIFCALSVAGCSKNAAQAPVTAGADKAVARVNGAPVWASDVKREAVAQGVIGPGEALDESSPQYHQLLDEVIDQKLLAAEASRRGLDQTPAARRALEAARERVLGDLLLEASVGKFVNERAVNGLYQEMLINQTPADRGGGPPVTLAAARPKIVRFLTYDEVKDLILDLRRRAKVETLIAPSAALATDVGEPASAPASAPAVNGAAP